MTSPLILIPARLASTRLPGKPLADIAGKPMIVRVLERALAANIGDVAVACDGPEIAEAVERAGGRAILTDPDLPSGSDRIWAASKRIDQVAHHDIIINLQGDMPTFDPSLLTSLLAVMHNTPSDIGTLVAPITDDAEKTDPAVVKAVISWETGIGNRESKDDDSLTPISRSPFPDSLQIGRALYFTRATAPSGDGPLYHHIGVYAYRTSALSRFVSLPPSPLEKREKLEQLRALEAGMSIGVAKVDRAPVGVDTAQTLEQVRKHYEHHL